MSRAAAIVLGVLGALEIVTLGVLVINLATVHEQVITRAIGPVHGAIYLTVVVMLLLIPRLRWATRLLGLVPVVGGALALWRALRRPD